MWAQRRHIFKVHQLTQNFAAVFGPGSINTQIRGVYADWPLFPDRYNSTLSWFNATVGFPGDFLYGMAITGYFGGIYSHRPLPFHHPPPHTEPNPVDRARCALTPFPPHRRRKDARPDADA